MNCFRTCIFVILKTTRSKPRIGRLSCELLSNLYLRHIENNAKKHGYWLLALWIAFELVSSSYWKQRPVSTAFRRPRCELLSNLYLRHIENNCVTQSICRTKLWIAFELVSSSYWKQLHTQRWRKRLSCELLSNLYLRHIENNFYRNKTKLRKLWIAFELVSSSYWKQPLALEAIAQRSCELLSNLYLRHIENNNFFIK